MHCTATATEPAGACRACLVDEWINTRKHKNEQSVTKLLIIAGATSTIQAPAFRPTASGLLSHGIAASGLLATEPGLCQRRQVQTPAKSSSSRVQALHSMNRIKPYTPAGIFWEALGQFGEPSPATVCARSRFSLLSAIQYTSLCCAVGLHGQAQRGST